VIDQEGSKSELKPVKHRLEDGLSPIPVPQSGQVEVCESTPLAVYANYCRLSGTPEELLIDCGLSTQQTPTGSIDVKQRVVTGWSTAKRLLQLLRLAVQRHEAAFGILEIEVQKRAGQ
jgi:hypothetical protein